MANELGLPEFIALSGEQVTEEQSEGTKGFNDNGEVTTEEQPKEDTPSEEKTLGQTLFELLKSESVLTLPDEYEFDGEVSGLRTAFETQRELDKQDVASQFIQSVPEQLRDIYEAALSGVDNIDELLTLKKKSLTEFDTSTLESQKQIVERNLIEKGIKESIAKQIVESFEKDGSIEVEAKSIVDAGKKAAQEQIKLLKQQKEQEQIEFAKQQEIQMKEFVTSLDTTLDSIPWSADKKKQVVSDLLVVDKDGRNSVQKKLDAIYANPKHLVEFVDFLSYYDGKEFNLTKYKKIEQKEAQKVKSEWEEKLSKSGNFSTKTNSRDEYNFDLSNVTV